MADIEIYDAIKRNFAERKKWSDNGSSDYIEVYFRIDTTGFNCINQGFETEEDRNAFCAEASNLIKKFNISENCGHRQTDEYLYAHPQNISGIVAKSKVEDIAKAINDSRTMKIRWVDVYEEYFQISDGEYKIILENKREEIVKAIIEGCVTQRSNRYCISNEVIRSIVERFKVNRINAQEDINTQGMTYMFVCEIVNELIATGYLKAVTQEKILYIRTIKRMKQKKEEIVLENQLSF